MANYYYKATYHFDNMLFEHLAGEHLLEAIKSEYIYLRNIACDEINLHLKEWNEEFEKLGYPDRSKDDELYDFGGTKYCDFIREKQGAIIESVNERYATIVHLCTSKVCDIEGEVIVNGKSLTKLNVTLKPFN